MNDIIKKVEEIVEREVENDLLKSEISELKKMLKTGFEAKTDGYDRIPKLMSTADEKKLAKFYDNFGNQEAETDQNLISKKPTHQPSKRPYNQ